MIIFKTFLKVLNKCKLPVILYTVILLFFAGFSLQSNEQSNDFVASQPKIYMINDDPQGKISISLTKYLEKHCHIVDLAADQDADDALFYRDISYVVHIPKHFHEEFMQGKKPQLKVKGINDYNASLAEMMIERYLSSAAFYQQAGYEEDTFIAHIEEAMAQQSDVEMTSSLDSDGLTNAAYYFNFSNYAIMAGCIYVICLILSCFKNEMIAKRTIISSYDYRKLNRVLLLSNGAFALVLWLFYVIISFVLLKHIMFTMHGVVYMINSLLFTCCAVALAFLIANLMTNKNAINGLVNVIALGSSFLCGAFVPVEMLPDIVLKIAHVLPSYWFIHTNNLLTGIETINAETLQPLLVNMGVMMIFTLSFVILTNIIAKRKRKFA